MRDSLLDEIESQDGGKRRSRLEIIYTILKVLSSRGPMKKTRIIQYANLNTKIFEDHVTSTLLDRGFLSFDEKKRLYSISGKGVRLLRILEALNILGLIRLGQEGSYTNKGLESMSFLNALKSIGKADGLEHSQVFDNILSYKVKCNDESIDVYVVKCVSDVIGKAELMTLVARGKRSIVFYGDFSGLAGRRIVINYSDNGSEEHRSILIPLPKNVSIEFIARELRLGLSKLGCEF